MNHIIYKLTSTSNITYKLNQESIQDLITGKYDSVTVSRDMRNLKILGVVDFWSTSDSYQPWRWRFTKFGISYCRWHKFGLNWEVHIPIED